jgi:hypothetical protein
MIISIMPNAAWAECCGSTGNPHRYRHQWHAPFALLLEDRHRIGPVGRRLVVRVAGARHLFAQRLARASRSSVDGRLAMKVSISALSPVASIMRQ